MKYPRDIWKYVNETLTHPNIIYIYKIFFSLPAFITKRCYAIFISLVHEMAEKVFFSTVLMLSYFSQYIKGETKVAATR